MTAEPLRLYCKYIMKKLKQLGNFVQSKRKNPNNGRVYSATGIAQTINCAGGGQREPYIIEITYERIESISRGGTRQHESSVVDKKQVAFYLPTLYDLNGRIQGGGD